MQKSFIFPNVHVLNYFQKIETSLLNNEYLKKFLFTTVNTK